MERMTRAIAKPVRATKVAWTQGETGLRRLSSEAAPSGHLRPASKAYSKNFMHTSALKGEIYQLQLALIERV
jgi:hypothetical protein